MDSNEKKFEISSTDAINQLQSCLDEISKLSLDWTTDLYILEFRNLEINPAIFALIVQVLDQLQPRASTSTKFRWDRVTFHYCCFAKDGKARRSSRLAKNEGGCVSPDDRRLLGATVARRISSRLYLNQSHEILECLFSSLRLEMKELDLNQMGCLSTLECERLGGLVLRSVALEHLKLRLGYVQEPEMLVETIGNAVHLRELWIMRNRSFMPFQQGNDIALRLLKNSLNRLRKLSLLWNVISDQHFMEIVEILPTSRLEALCLPLNNIRSQGILAFAAHLPRIKCLKEVEIGSNPWESDQEGCEQCWTALLEGLIDNYSIESLSACELTALEKLVQYYCNLNRAGRRILATPNSVPASLWPLILERAGNATYNVDESIIDYESTVQQYRAESISFFLQNSRSPLLQGSPRKRTKIIRYS